MPLKICGLLLGAPDTTGWTADERGLRRLEDSVSGPISVICVHLRASAVSPSADGLFALAEWQIARWLARAIIACHTTV